MPETEFVPKGFTPRREGFYRRFSRKGAETLRRKGRGEGKFFADTAQRREGAEAQRFYIRREFFSQILRKGAKAQRHKGFIGREFFSQILRKGAETRRRRGAKVFKDAEEEREGIFSQILRKGAETLRRKGRGERELTTGLWRSKRAF